MTHALDDGGHRQLKDTVYLQLRDDIVNGTLPPGAVLREAELATRFGVSKTPLRDANGNIVIVDANGITSTMSPYGFFGSAQESE